MWYQREPVTLLSVVRRRIEHNVLWVKPPLAIRLRVSRALKTVVYQTIGPFQSSEYGNKHAGLLANHRVFVTIICGCCCCCWIIEAGRSTCFSLLTVIGDILFDLKMWICGIEFGCCFGWFRWKCKLRIYRSLPRILSFNLE